MKPNYNVNQKNRINIRKHYEKPVVERINLVPDEAVLGACKTVSSGAGPAAIDFCGTLPCLNPAS